MYISKFLFSDRRMAWLWLIVRVYVGWQWVEAGWGKVTNSTWTSGTSLSGFLSGALAKTTGAHPDVSSWYGWLISHVGLPGVHVFSYLVAYGELIVGLALIVGLFTGLAAFGAAFMNMNYMLSGALSVNPQLFLIEILLILAWRTAGWIGLDRFVLKSASGNH